MNTPSKVRKYESYYTTRRTGPLRVVAASRYESESESESESSRVSSHRGHPCSRRYDRHASCPPTAWRRATWTRPTDIRSRGDIAGGRGGRPGPRTRTSERPTTSRDAHPSSRANTRPTRARTSRSRARSVSRVSNDAGRPTGGRRGEDRVHRRVSDGGRAEVRHARDACRPRSRGRRWKRRGHARRLDRSAWKEKRAGGGARTSRAPERPDPRGAPRVRVCGARRVLEAKFPPSAVCFDRAREARAKRDIIGHNIRMGI